MRNLVNNCANDIDCLEWGGGNISLNQTYGLSDADQLVVGGMDDDVMKIGADGQLMPVE